MCLKFHPQSHSDHNVPFIFNLFELKSSGAFWHAASMMEYVGGKMRQKQHIGRTTRFGVGGYDIKEEG